jgi:hypothetical protein
MPYFIFIVSPLFLIFFLFLAKKESYTFHLSIFLSRHLTFSLPFSASSHLALTASTMICSQLSRSLAWLSCRIDFSRFRTASIVGEILTMEAQWVAKPAMLRHLAGLHPEWTRPQLAEACDSSLSFVKKWLKRFREADPNDLQVLFSRSRARHTPPPPLDLRRVPRVIEIRVAPPENLQRTPGPRTILYYLKRDADLQAQGIAPPHSTRTSLQNPAQARADPRSPRAHTHPVRAA